MIDLAVVVVLALASYRLARIVARDTITEPFRARLYEWSWIDPDGGRGDPVPRKGQLRCYVNELLTCMLCLGLWVSVGVFAVYDATIGYSHGTAGWLLGAGAVAGAQALLSTWEGD